MRTHAPTYGVVIAGRNGSVVIARHNGSVVMARHNGSAHEPVYVHDVRAMMYVQTEPVFVHGAPTRCTYTGSGWHAPRPGTGRWAGRGHVEDGCRSHGVSMYVRLA
jgi:hypothetical protein